MYSILADTSIFCFLISSPFHFNGTAEYILDTLKKSHFYLEKKKKKDLASEMILSK